MWCNLFCKKIVYLDFQLFISSLHSFSLYDVRNDFVLRRPKQEQNSVDDAVLTRSF